MPDSNITKLALADSLKKLMAEKAFGKIRVDDIVSGCGLTRQSFYYHFKDKFDLMNWIYYTETARFMASYDTLQHWTDGLKDLCYYMQQNKTFYKNALNTTGQNSFPEYLNNYISAVSISAIEGMLDAEYDQEKWDFIVSFFATAFVAIIIRWANNGMKDDPEDFIAKIRGLFDGSILRELESRSREKNRSSYNESLCGYCTETGASIMKNMVNYVMEASPSFENKELSAVDSLVLSQLAYLKFDHVVPSLSETSSPVPIRDVAAVEEPDTLFQDVRESKSNRQLLSAFVNSPRFCDTKLAFYVNQLDEKTEKQFSAVTFLLSDDSAYIAFRGTDSTFIGWKEDFNMAFTSPIPSQEEGVAYLNTVANRIPCKLRIGGHSKGGNIAVYSAIHCCKSTQNRIEQIFSHDGPGFRDEVFHSAGYQIVKDRIHKTLPQSSMIGMLLQHQERYSVVKSNRIWFMQHDPFSWLVDGGDFQYIPTITKSALYMNGTLNEWVNLLDDQKRELFVNTLFQVLEATEAATFYDLTGDWPKRAFAVIGAIRGINDETRAFLYQTIRSLFVLAAKNIRYL